METLHCVYMFVSVSVCRMVCLYIQYFECVLITSVRNDHMCAVFQITDSIVVMYHMLLAQCRIC